MDLVGRRAGVFDRVGGDDRDRVAELEHLLLAQDRTVPAVALVGREGDQAGDRVLALDVLPGDDLGDARHFLGFARVDALDVGVRDLRLHERQTQGVGGHAQRDVGAEVPRSRHLGERRGTVVARAEDRTVLLGLVEHLGGRLLAAHHRRRVHDRVDQRLIAGAAAKIAVTVEPGANLLAGWGRIAVEQHLRRHDEAGRADAALRAAVGHPGDLQRMQIARRSDAFDGDDLGPRRQFLRAGSCSSGRACRR